MTTAMFSSLQTAPSLMERLSAIVSPENVITGAGVEVYATDVYRSRALPMAVVRPGTVDALRAVVATATRDGVAVVTRGGGASYTDAYLPISANSILLDTGALDKIVEINVRDMYVTVQPGVTWAALSQALAKQGLRTQFRGPFSGLVATIGGALSQGALGHGSGAFGVSAESVLAFEIVTASGDLLKTGQAGSSRGEPFFRYYGPDLTGLFTGDCGALGVKSAITLRLARQRPAFDCVSFAMADFSALHALMADTAAERLEEKSFGLDLALSQGQIGRQDAGSVAKIARAVLADAAGLRSGLASLTRMALAGRKAMGGSPYAAHYIVEGVSGAEVKARIAALRRIGAKHGSEIANTVPMVVHGMPFAPLHNALGPKGERWAPLHGILPHSSVGAFHNDLTAYLSEQAEEMKRHRVYAGAMFASVGATAFLYEPALYWQDARTAFHRSMMDDAYLAQLPEYPDNPQGAALVAKLRSDITGIMHGFDAAHFQIGKFYPYLDGREPLSVDLLRAIKQRVDPNDLLNPGALGL